MANSTYWVILFPGGRKVQLTKDNYNKAVMQDAVATVIIPEGEFKITGNKRIFQMGVNHFLVADAKKVTK